MSEERRFIMTWPELDSSVECKPLEVNREIYDWWMDRLPIKAVQNHTLITGKDMNIMDVWLPEPALSIPVSEVTYIQMTDCPLGYGTLSYNERGGFCGGRIGEIDVIYGPLTEEMPFYYCFQVVEEDFGELKDVGQRVWNSIYKTKEIITVELTLKQ